MRIRHPWLTKLLGCLAALVLRIWFRTWRVTGSEAVPGFDITRPGTGPCIYCLWHDDILIPLSQSRHSYTPTAALVSQHRDGGYLTELLQQLRIRPVRGSTSRGGDKALRELLRVAQTHSVFITPDGPRGPRRVAKPGIVFLAAQTGLPILQVACRARAAWRIRGSWTDLLLPCPGTRAEYVIGAPIHVPASATREELDAALAQLQLAMDRLHGDAPPNALQTPAAPQNTDAAFAENAAPPGEPRPAQAA